MTRIWTLTGTPDDERALAEAASLLRQGATVAFPTETVYGLGADGLNPAAVRRIFQAKGRPADNPLILHIASDQALSGLADPIPSLARGLTRAFWPGPLTLILPRRPVVPDEVTAGLATVAVRQPNHPVALRLIELTGRPLAAPSANRSGRPSPTRADHVRADLWGRIDGLIDAGATPLGVESTVLDLTTHPPALLRPGGITLEQLEEVIGPIRVEGGPGPETPKAPGMKYAHYAPKARLTLVTGTPEEVSRWIQREAQSLLEAGIRVGVLASAENAGGYPPGALVLIAGRRQHLPEVAEGLFAALRQFDEAGVQVILAEGYPEVGLGRAVMNRLRKAARRVVEAGDR